MGCAISAKSKWELREAENPSGPAAMWPREQAGHKPATDRQFTLKTALDPRRVSTHTIVEGLLLRYRQIATSMIDSTSSSGFTIGPASPQEGRQAIARPLTCPEVWSHLRS